MAPVTAAVLVLSSVVLLHPTRSDASVLNIQRSGDEISVSLKDLGAQPKQISKELRHSGISATVKQVPVADPQVGYFTSVQTAGGVSDDPANAVETVGETNGMFKRFKLHIGSVIQLNVGRKAGPSEPYASFFDETLPGGKFHCAGVLSQRVSAIASRISTVVKTVEWRRQDAASGVSETTPSESADGYVQRIISTSRQSVIVFVGSTPTANSSDQTCAP